VLQRPLKFADFCVVSTNLIAKWQRFVMEVSGDATLTDEGKLDQR